MSRPPTLAQLISVGLPDELRNIIKAGSPEGNLGIGASAPRYLGGDDGKIMVYTLLEAGLSNLGTCA